MSKKEIITILAISIIISFCTTVTFNLITSERPTVDEFDNLCKGMTSEYSIHQINNNPEIVKEIERTIATVMQRNYGTLWKWKIPKECYVREI